jgi:hypothetical protein
LKEQDLRKEAIRRQEMEKIELHEEYVYYDAGREQGWFYKLFCCPYYGKITSGEYFDYIFLLSTVFFFRVILS